MQKPAISPGFLARIPGRPMDRFLFFSGFVPHVCEPKADKRGLLGIEDPGWGSCPQIKAGCFSNLPVSKRRNHTGRSLSRQSQPPRDWRLIMALSESRAAQWAVSSGSVLKSPTRVPQNQLGGLICVSEATVKRKMEIKSTPRLQRPCKPVRQTTESACHGMRWLSLVFPCFPLPSFA